MRTVKFFGFGLGDCSKRAICCCCLRLGKMKSEQQVPVWEAGCLQVLFAAEGDGGEVSWACRDPGAPHRRLLLCQPRTPRVCCSRPSRAPSASPLCPILSPRRGPRPPHHMLPTARALLRRGQMPSSALPLPGDLSFLIPASPWVRLAGALVLRLSCSSASHLFLPSRYALEPQPPAEPGL